MTHILAYADPSLDGPVPPGTVRALVGFDIAPRPRESVIGPRRWGWVIVAAMQSCRVAVVIATPGARSFALMTT